MSSWNGSLALVPAVSGVLQDNYGWTLAIAGARDGANRISILGKLTEAGDPAQPLSPAARVHRHIAAPDAVLRGEILRSGTNWTGSFGGLLRLSNGSPWSGEGPIDLRGEPL